MGNCLLVRSLGLLLIVICSSSVGWSAELPSALDLVSEDAAFCLEVPHLDETWTQFEKSPLIGRIRSFPEFQRLLANREFQQFQGIDDHIAKQTGRKASAQLRALFGKTLVLAMYVPANGKPQGILIGEANDEASIDMVFATWAKLEPNEVTSVRTFQNHPYRQRKKHANAAESIYFTKHGRWFAVSDQEGLIQEVINRFRVVTGKNGRLPIAGSLGQSQSYQRNRQRLKSDAAAYVHISARPWDRGLEEASKDDRQPINPAAIWKRVSAVSAGLQFEHGLVCDAVVDLETSQLSTDWTKFVATAAKEPAWNHRIPADAIMAISGQLDIAPLINYVLDQIPSSDRDELAKKRRIAQSLLGGNDLFDSVLPALARDVCGFVVTRFDDRSKRIRLDGALEFTMSSPDDTKLLNDVARGFEMGLNFLAAYFSAEGQKAVSLEKDKSDSTKLFWLPDSVPFPVAYGLKGQSLVIAGSLERLKQTLDLLDSKASQSRLIEHSQRHFPQSNQLVWLDTALARQVLERNGTDVARLLSHGSNAESSKIANHIEQLRPILALIDSLFIAGRIESDHIRVTFGGGLDSK